MITSNKLNTGFFSAPNWFFDYFSVSRSSASELESFCRSLPHQTDSTSALQGGEKRKRRWREGWGGGGRLFERGDYFKYFWLRWEGAIIRVRRLIEGRLLFEEIRY